MYAFILVSLLAGQTQTLCADKGHEISSHKMAMQSDERDGRANKGASYVIVYENAKDMGR